MVRSRRAGNDTYPATPISNGRRRPRLSTERPGDYLTERQPMRQAVRVSWTTDSLAAGRVRSPGGPGDTYDRERPKAVRLPNSTNRRKR